MFCCTHLQIQYLPYAIHRVKAKPSPIQKGRRPETKHTNTFEKGGQKYTVDAFVVNGNNCVVYQATTPTGVHMYFNKNKDDDMKLVHILNNNNNFVTHSNLIHQGKPVKRKAGDTDNNIKAQAFVFLIILQDDESLDEAIERLGKEFASILAQHKKPFDKNGKVYAEFGRCVNVTELKLNELIDDNSTDEAVILMFNEYFRNGTFESHLAEDIIADYYEYKGVDARTGLTNPNLKTHSLPTKSSSSSTITTKIRTTTIKIIIKRKSPLLQTSY